MNDPLKRFLRRFESRSEAPAGEWEQIQAKLPQSRLQMSQGSSARTFLFLRPKAVFSFATAAALALVVFFSANQSRVNSKNQSRVNPEAQSGVNSEMLSDEDAVEFIENELVISIENGDTFEGSEYLSLLD